MQVTCLVSVYILSGFRFSAKYILSVSTDRYKGRCCFMKCFQRLTLSFDGYKSMVIVTSLQL